MIPRHLSPVIEKFRSEYPILSIVGPRQSGKTTLVKTLFPKYDYFSLENIDIRQQAENDPRRFLEDCGKNIILDEIQRVPSLFSYLQELVDTDPSPCQYVLTGSHQFLLMENISQSLAGRIITLKLFPLTISELTRRKPDVDLDSVITPKSQASKRTPGNLESLILQGFYPRIHDKKLTPRKWIENYVLTYLERDIRLIVNVSDLRVFEHFLKVIAAYSGQLTNYAAISNTIGVSLPTVKRWISILEASGLILVLPPHHKNFLKRLVKTPKIYFLDTGLLCFLLGIKTVSELKSHPLYGAIFETLIVSEFFKRISNLGEAPPLHFWRDKTGNEIDLIVDLGSKILPIEIKLSKTFSEDFFKNIHKWLQLSGNQNKNGILLYNGSQIVGKNRPVHAYPWWAF